MGRSASVAQGSVTRRWHLAPPLAVSVAGQAPPLNFRVQYVTFFLDTLAAFAYRTITVVQFSASGTPLMFLHIDAHNGLAVYDQIVRQIKFSVADGVLTAGDQVPSVRELARELAINPNTVARAYRQLQDDAVLEPVRGTGLLVASGARKACLGARKRLIRARLRDVLLEAHHGGLEAEQIESLFQTELDAIQKKKR